MTKQEVVDHFESAEVQVALDNADALSTEQMREMAAVDLLGSIVTIYTAIRPFLEWADSFFLFGPRIKTPIRTFKEFLDKVTGYVEGE